MGFQFIMGSQYHLVCGKRQINVTALWIKLQKSKASCCRFLPAQKSFWAEQRPKVLQPFTVQWQWWCLHENDEPDTVYQVIYASCFFARFIPQNRVLNVREWIFHEIPVRVEIYLICKIVSNLRSCIFHNW